MFNRRAVLSALAATLLSVSACTVQPLYGEKNSYGQVNNVSVADVDTRVAQQVRNRLLFLLNGSGATPDSPEFEASLKITSNAQGILSVNKNDESDLTARRVKITGTLDILNIKTGQILKTYTRTKYSSFDNSTQSFANGRALIDAENRAAIEIAEDFRALIISFTLKQ